MILTTNTYDKQTMKQQEGAYTIGNGYMHIRGSLDFDLSYAPQNETYWRMPANVTIEKARHPYSKWGTYIPGIVGQHPLLNEEMVNLPYLCGINLMIDQKIFQFDTDSITDFSQSFHMDTSEYEYQFTIPYDQGDIVVHVRRYCDWNDPHRMVQTIKIHAPKHVMIDLQCFLDLDVATNGFCHFINRKGFANEERIGYEIKTDLKNTVAAFQKIETDGEKQTAVYDGVRVSIGIRKYGNLFVQRTSAISSSLESVDPLSDARARLDDFANETKAYQDHKLVCQSRWSLHRMLIDGDEKAQQALDFSIYHLMRSKSIFDKVAIDAKGAAGEAYFGHYFWDTEIYLLPFYLYTNPKQAKDLLMFRVHTLQAAIDNAAEYGYEGAKYPWESSISGKEQCPNWQYKDHEIHVSFDIVYAMQEYLSVTKDELTCQESFFPVVENIALFALSRSYREHDGTMHINGVMGPDEYIMFCNDNYYTNYMAAYAVEVYLEWCQRFEKPCQKQEELKYFLEHLHLPVQDDILLQCERFSTFEDVDFQKVWKQKDKPFGAQVSQEYNYRTKALKQADTLTLFYLFDEFYPDKLQVNMEYYLPITTHDSSLSYVIHAILSARLKKREQAYEFFKQACNIDFEGMGAAEGVHIANAGGLWQTVVFGFAGFKNLMWSDDHVELHPCLPKHWNRVQFKLCIQDKIYVFTITQEQSKIELQEKAYAEY